MGRRRGGGNGISWLPYPLFDQRPGFFLGIAFSLMLILGVLFWYLLFELRTPEAGRILAVAICVDVITLAVNIYMICRVGYESFLHDFGISYSLNLILSIIGLYIARVELIANPDGSQMIAVWRFFLFVFISALMNLLPTILICLLMWIIMSIFGTRR